MGQTRLPAIEAGGFFVLRTPLLPFSTLSTWAEGLRAPTATGEDLEATVAEDRYLLRARLLELVSHPAVREALFVASPSLVHSLSAWRDDPESERGQKVERTVVRYLVRMAGRATPFGLCAGVSVGTVGARTRLLLGEQKDYLRHARLDGDYLVALTEALGCEPAIRHATTYRPNSSLYRAAGQLRYAEARLDGSTRSYHLVSVEPTEYLEATLARASHGARFDALAEALTDDDVPREEADDFIGQLVDAQLLVSDLAPQVTGSEPIHDLVDQLAREEGTQQVADRLGAARDALARLDASPLGSSTSAYDAIEAGLRVLPAKVEPSRLFQVDLTKPVREATLGGAVVAEIRRGVELLWRLSTTARETGISRFRDAFVARYGACEVPLVAALDEEVGLGFEKSMAPSAEASPLLDGLIFPAGGADDGEQQVAWNSRTDLLFRKLQEALRTGAHEIVLEQSEVDEVAQKNPRRLSSSLAATVTLAARSAEALAEGDCLVWMHAVAGPSGANLLGRFCHGDAQLAEFVTQYLRSEEALRPEAVFAEIVHLPEGRIGNLLLRPLLRGYEIPYLGRSGAPIDRQIPLSDLLLSVVDQRVILRSRRLDREVIPRLTSAHNFSHPHNLGVYRFLCALQFQDVAGGFIFSWGALDSARFLPRVRVGRLVVALARWRLDAEELKRIGTAKGARRFAEVRALKLARNLPRWVGVVDNDNVLPLDLDNALIVEAWTQLIKGRTSMTLTEMFGTEAMCVHGSEGGFVHELVVPFVVEDTTPTARARGGSQPMGARTFAPGSEWLYIKLYTGPATADLVLRDVLAAPIREVLESGAADSWFFIRYGDPGWHLRVRFHGAPARLQSEVLPMLEAAARAAMGGALVWKVQLDTYEREVERYGGDSGVALAEELFHADSDACLSIVQAFSGDEGADLRWRLAMRGMDMLLDDLGFDLAGKHDVMHECRRAFKHEFHADGVLAKQLGDSFRKKRLELERLLDHSDRTNPMLELGVTILARRSERVRSVGASLRQRTSLLGQTLPSLAQSFLHMHANRLLHAAARAQEFVLYDFLDRIYEGRLARSRGRRPSERRGGAR